MKNRQIQNWGIGILGVWLIVSPWVMGYSNQANPMWNAVIVGLLIAGLSGLSFTSQQRIHQY